MYRRASAVLPTLSRLGVGRFIYRAAYGDFPQPVRAQERAFLSTPRGSRSVRDEFSKLRTAMAEAGSLKTLGDRPLVVVTAQKGALDGWAAAQNELASLSTDSTHRTVTTATHAMLVEDRGAVAQSNRAIADVVASIRTSTPVTELEH
jgi:hypothetical protein